jgi:hypothetical protein
MFFGLALFFILTVSAFSGTAEAQTTQQVGAISADAAFPTPVSGCPGGNFHRFPRRFCRAFCPGDFCAARPPLAPAATPTGIPLPTPTATPLPTPTVAPTPVPTRAPAVPASAAPGPAPTPTPMPTSPSVPTPTPITVNKTPVAVPTTSASLASQQLYTNQTHTAFDPVSFTIVLLALLGIAGVVFVFFRRQWLQKIASLSIDRDATRRTLMAPTSMKSSQPALPAPSEFPAPQQFLEQ